MMKQLQKAIAIFRDFAFKQIINGNQKSYQHFGLIKLENIKYFTPNK